MKSLKLIAFLLAALLLLAACAGEPGAESRGTESRSTDTRSAEPVTQTTAPAQTEAHESAGTETLPPVETGSAAPSTAEATEAPLPETEVPPEERPAVEMENLPEPAPAKNYAELLDLLGGYDYQILPAGDPTEGDDGPGGDPGIELSGFEPETPGVERPSRICTDGKNLYLLDSYGITVMSAAGKDSRILCTFQVEREANSYLEEMFVSADRIGVIYTCSSFGQDADGNWFDTNSTHLVVYDTTDKSAPVHLSDCGIEGSYLAARRVGDTVYLLTNRYFWAVNPAGSPEAVVPHVLENGTSTPIPAEKIWLCPNPNSTALTVAASVSLRDGSVTDSMACSDASTAVWVEEDAVWLARPVLRFGTSAPYADGGYTVTDRSACRMTELKRLSPENGLAVADSCLLEGGVTGRFSLGRTDAGLCCVTALQEWNWSDYRDEANGWTNIRWGAGRKGSLLTVLDDDGNTVSRVERSAEAGRITACRFCGSLALLLTETGAEPVDLSDPANPAAPGPISGLKPEEVSAFLPDGSFLCFRAEEDNLILRRIGRGEGGALAVLSEITLPGCSGSPAQTDGSLLLAEAGQELLGFALDGSAEAGYRYLLLHMAGTELSDPVEFRLPYLPTNARGLLLDGILYICSPGTSYVADPESGELLATVTDAQG